MPNRTTMHVGELTRELRNRLYEVGFLYRHLARSLGRARFMTTLNPWTGFFRKHEQAVRDHRRDLESAIAASGHRARPCNCEEANGLLIELDHALTARTEPLAMERHVHELFTRLRTIVLERLDEGAELADRLGDAELAQRLKVLCTTERRLEGVMQDPWRSA